MAELEAVKKSSRKASRSWSNADEKKQRGKNNGNNENGKERERGKNNERKKRGNLSVSDKMSLLKLKLN